jgi:hypothetical protein
MNGYSAGNYQLMDADSGRQDQHARKILRTVTIPGSLTPKALYREYQLFSKFQCEKFIKNKNKPNTALLQT